MPDVTSSDQSDVDVADRTVVALHIALATKMPMRAVDEVTVTEGRGIVGDRYEGTKHRHVSIQSTGELADAGARWGETVDPGKTRRNILVTGGLLPRTPGRRLAIGAVEFEVVRDAAPCRVMDFEVGEGARIAMRRRGGIICRVLTSGSIGLGATMSIEAITP